MNGHPLIADDCLSERLVLSTPDFALQNRPLEGGRVDIGSQYFSRRRERVQFFYIAAVKIQNTLAVQDCLGKYFNCRILVGVFFNPIIYYEATISDTYNLRG